MEPGSEKSKVRTLGLRLALTTDFGLDCVLAQSLASELEIQMDVLKEPELVIGKACLWVR